MNPIEFAKTIYLGDRSIKSIYIDAWERTIKVEIDVISRVRSADGHWNYYSDEDIDDGLLTFDGVFSFEIVPKGAIPSDYITFFNVQQYSALDFEGYKFELGSADLEGPVVGAASLVILAKGLYLEDRLFGGKKIEI